MVFYSCVNVYVLCTCRSMCLLFTCVEDRKIQTVLLCLCPLYSLRQGLTELGAPPLSPNSRPSSILFSATAAGTCCHVWHFNMWMQGIWTKTFICTASTCTHWAFSPAPVPFILIGLEKDLKIWRDTCVIAQNWRTMFPSCLYSKTRQWKLYWVVSVE